jgi:hypothetical protein
MAYLDRQLALDPVARSYLVEALKTYNAGCFKATAVMAGAASERLVLRLRDALVVRLTEAGRPISASLCLPREKWFSRTVGEVGP